jgi:quercetin dioxygenase-like cupin family protein
VIKAGQLEVVQIVLAAGKAFPEHHVAGEITVLCLKGRIVFRTPASEQLMAPGDFIHLERGIPHSLQAQEDAVALLTICLS